MSTDPRVPAPASSDVAATSDVGLPPAARIYVLAVIAAGAATLGYELPRLQLSQLWLLGGLILVSAIAGTFKVRLPLSRSNSTMSVSYVVDFTSLLLLGPRATMVVAALSAWSQCTFNVSRRNPAHRTVFNIAAIVLTVQAAGAVFRWTGGVPGVLPWPEIMPPLFAAATAYYVVNTASVAIIVSLVSRQPLIRVWNDNFLWSAPSYFVGASVALFTATVVAVSNYWVLPVVLPPVYLTYRSYKVYLARLEGEQRHRKQIAELHQQTLAALDTAQQSEAKLQEAVESLRQSEERYALAAVGANDGLWDWDLRTNEIYFSPRWKAMLGFDPDEMGSTLADWFNRVHPEDIGSLRTALGAHLAEQTGHFEHEHRVRDKPGVYRWMLSRAVAVRDANGRATRVAGSQTDITERRAAQSRLEHAARHDALTELPNRVLFVELLERSLARAKRKDTRFAVLFLDVDRFKVINDSLGHLVGDQLLTGFARRVRGCLRTGDVLARLGGDEFTVLLDDIVGVEDATFVAERIQRELTEPFLLGGEQIVVSSSIGVALGSNAYERPDELLRDADTALYRAKAGGRARHVVFEPRMREHAVARLNLETELRRAVDRREFAVAYQPIVSLQTGALVGFEALLRWQRSNGQWVLPADFVPLAEETGLMVPIGAWVLSEACRQMASWQQRHRPGGPLRISVNLSPRQLQHPGLVEEVSHAIAYSGLAAGSLTFEITENALADDGEVEAAMRALKELPIQLQLDDFGTRYASLGQLHRLPIDALKIDRCFIGHDASGSELSPIIGTILALAARLGLDVIAEGVETSEQVTALRRLGCPAAQGFYFSKPTGAEAAEALIALSMATRLDGLGHPQIDSGPITTSHLQVH